VDENVSITHIHTSKHTHKHIISTAKSLTVNEWELAYPSAAQFFATLSGDGGILHCSHTAQSSINATIRLTSSSTPKFKSLYSNLTLKMAFWLKICVIVYTRALGVY